MNISFILTALTGYLLIIFKEVPRAFVNLFKNTFISTLSVNSKDRRMYKKINDYLLNMNKKCFNQNIEANTYYTSHQKHEFNATINYGVYICKIDTLTYMIVNKQRHDQTFEVSSTVNLSIFGLKRKQHMEVIYTNIQDLKDNNTIKVFNSIREYDEGVCVLAKNMDDVFMMNKQYLIDNIDIWRNNEHFFTSKGIIHKLGILLYGQPGTGKSTISRAIATYTGFDTYIIPLGSFKEQSQLLDKLKTIPKNSIVLFEDIDCLIGDRESNDNKDESLLNIVLNFIDGLCSPSNCIIIATTNHIQKLDNAFTRPGRFDVKMEMKNLDIQTAQQMCDHFGFKLQDVYDKIPAEINPAELQNILISKIYDK